jgi:hypothetical protein
MPLGCAFDKATVDVPTDAAVRGASEPIARTAPTARVRVLNIGRFMAPPETTLQDEATRHRGDDGHAGRPPGPGRLKCRIDVSA